MTTKSNYQQRFGAIYRKYFPLLCCYASFLLKDDVEAEDVVQELFISLLEKDNLELPEGENAVKAYLFKGTYNKCINALKHKAVQNKYVEYLQHLEYLMVDESDYPLAALIESELMEMYEQAVEKLPERCRKIFRMRREEKLDYPEIAKQLNIRESTARVQMIKATEKLEKMLKPYLPLIIFIFGK